MKIPTEDFSDVTLAIGDTQRDDFRGGNWVLGCWSWRLTRWRHLFGKFITKTSGVTWWPNFQLMHVASLVAKFQLMQVMPPGGQISNLFKWHHLVAKFPTMQEAPTCT